MLDEKVKKDRWSWYDRYYDNKNSSKLNEMQSALENERQTREKLQTMGKEEHKMWWYDGAYLPKSGVLPKAVEAKPKPKKEEGWYYGTREFERNPPWHYHQYYPHDPFWYKRMPAGFLEDKLRAGPHPELLKE